MQVDMRAILALLNLAAKNDVRYYLNGVLIRFGLNSTKYYATTGSILGKIEIKESGICDADVIIPRDRLEKIKLNKKNYFAELIPLGTSWRLTYLPGMVDIIFDPIAGIFPDCDRVIPATTTGESGNYNIDLLDKFVSANKVLGASSRAAGNLKLSQNGPTSAALVKLDVCPEFTGVIMPFRI